MKDWNFLIDLPFPNFVWVVRVETVFKVFKELRKNIKWNGIDVRITYLP